MIKFTIFILIFIHTNLAYLEEDKGSVDFSSIKNIIKSDLLEKVVEEKNKKIAKIEEEKKTKKVQMYNYPLEDDFWGFISEYWLIENSTSLRWDFIRPEYGLRTAIRQMFETLGFYELTFKVLLVNNPRLMHFSLPGGKNGHIFLVSLPFIRIMDLTKLEIALIVLEDFLRLQAGYLKSYTRDKKLDEYFGKNFFGKKIDKNIIKIILKKYTSFVFNKGFTFQQQFEITKKMNDILKSSKKVWKVYRNLLAKIDVLVKTNSDYSHYNKIYPSPEFQLNWLDPQKQTK